MGYGDELMVAGKCRILQQTDPRKVRLEYGKRLWNIVFDHNPRIARPDESGDFQVYEARRAGLRPYCKLKTADRWQWLDYKPDVGEIYLQPEELAFAARFDPDVIIEPNLKGNASPNKDWGRVRWTDLVFRLHELGRRAVQLGPHGAQRIVGADFIETPNFRLAVAVLARARGAILTEGGLHHAAAAVGVRSVVIYGGYISPRQTGYDLHENIFTGGEPCGMRIPCKHCRRAMDAITPELVLERFAKLQLGRELD